MRRRRRLHRDWAHGEGIWHPAAQSLRVLFSMEHYGFAEYLAQRPHQLKAAINLDTLATPCTGNWDFPCIGG